MQRSISSWTVGSVAALFSICLLHAQNAQNFDPQLAGEVNLIRAEVARSNAALRQYTWTEHTEVLVKGKPQSSTDLACRYDAAGQLVKTPVAINAAESANGVSKRPIVRKKSEQQDYIERAVSLIAIYFPPEPAQLDAMLARGDAGIEPSTPGKLQIRFKNYHQRGDSMIFTYDPVSKVLSHITVLSTLGSPKDPVTLDAVFEALPDGVNHLASTTVSAQSKKIQVKMRNVSYTRATVR